jgi:hypothetical protein
LALLIALISVSSATIPVFYNLFSTKNAILTASFQGVSNDGISILFSNSGERPGTILNGSIFVGNDTNPPSELESIVPVVSGKPSTIVLPPHSDTLVNFTSVVSAGLKDEYEKAAISDLAKRSDDRRRQQCYVALMPMDYHGDFLNFRIPVDCGLIIGFLCTTRGVTVPNFIPCLPVNRHSD